jgi:hypothetical protein
MIAVIARHRRNWKSQISPKRFQFLTRISSAPSVPPRFKVLGFNFRSVLSVLISGKVCWSHGKKDILAAVHRSGRADGHLSSAVVEPGAYLAAAGALLVDRLSQRMVELNWLIEKPLNHKNGNRSLARPRGESAAIAAEGSLMGNCYLAACREAAQHK